MQDALVFKKSENLSLVARRKLRDERWRSVWSAGELDMDILDGNIFLHAR
jgi:hypothetical protein